MHLQLSHSTLLIFLTNLSKTLFILHVGLRGLCFSKNKVDRLNAHLSGLSLTGLAAEPIIGFFQSPRTVHKYKCDLALGPWSHVCEQNNCKPSWGISICSNSVVPPVYIHVKNFIKKIVQDRMTSYYKFTGTAKEKCAIFYFAYRNCMSS